MEVDEDPDEAMTSSLHQTTNNNNNNNNHHIKPSGGVGGVKVLDDSSDLPKGTDLTNLVSDGNQSNTECNPIDPSRLSLESCEDAVGSRSQESSKCNLHQSDSRMEQRSPAPSEEPILVCNHASPDQKEILSSSSKPNTDDDVTKVSDLSSSGNIDRERSRLLEESSASSVCEARETARESTTDGHVGNDRVSADGPVRVAAGMVHTAGSPINADDVTVSVRKSTDNVDATTSPPVATPEIGNHVTTQSGSNSVSMKMKNEASNLDQFKAVSVVEIVSDVEEEAPIKSNKTFTSEQLGPIGLPAEDCESTSESIRVPVLGSELSPNVIETRSPSSQSQDIALLDESTSPHPVSAENKLTDHDSDKDRGSSPVLKHSNSCSPASATPKPSHSRAIHDSKSNSPVTSVSDNVKSKDSVISSGPAFLASSFAVAASLHSSHLLSSLAAETAMMGTVAEKDGISSCSAHRGGGRPWIAGYSEADGTSTGPCSLLHHQHQHPQQQQRSLGGHMTMLHSRNSCKTLKCPKCNWHYKYQETLDIHMREKHPEGESDCSHCLAGSVHPKLARGESYKCGYKPYRCTVCNYSTTTKGNLSIHMQSDKHVNNVQELSLRAITGSTHHGLPVSESTGAVSASDVLLSSPIVINRTLSKPLNATSSSDAGLSLSRGDTLVSATREGGSLHSASTLLSSSSNKGQGQSQRQKQQKSSWRCDFCDYETPIARNLRIHATSEKHISMVMALRQGSVTMSPPPTGLGRVQTASSSSYSTTLSQSSNMRSGPDCDGRMLGLEGFSSSSLLHDPLFSNTILQSASRVASLTAPNYNTVFGCAVCNAFHTDSLPELETHMAKDRRGDSHTANEHVTMTPDQHFLCTLCGYRSNLKANFSLHCKTDKHLQRISLVNHVREGGADNLWYLSAVINSTSSPAPPAVHIVCHPCSFHSNAGYKMRAHASTAIHTTLTSLMEKLTAGEQEEKVRWAASKKTEMCIAEKTESSIGRREESDTAADESVQTTISVEHDDENPGTAEKGEEQRSGFLQYECGVCHGVRASIPDLISHVRRRHLMLGDLDGSRGERHLAADLLTGAMDGFSVSLRNSTSVEAEVTTPDEPMESSPELDLHSTRSDHSTEDAHVAYRRDSDEEQDKRGVLKSANLIQMHESKAEEFSSNVHTIACPEMKSQTLDALPVTLKTIISSMSHEPDSHPRRISPTEGCKEEADAEGNIDAGHPVTCPLCATQVLSCSSLTSHLKEEHKTSDEGISRVLALVSPAETVADRKSPQDSHSTFCRVLPSAASSAAAPSESNRCENSASNADVSSAQDGLTQKKSSVTCAPVATPPSLKCRVCDRDYDMSIDLYTHQVRAGHLSLKNTLRGPAYLCWKKGCNQYFAASETLLSHYRNIHHVGLKAGAVFEREKTQHKGQGQTTKGEGQGIPIPSGSESAAISGLSETHGHRLSTPHEEDTEACFGPAHSNDGLTNNIGAATGAEHSSFTDSISKDYHPTVASSLSNPEQLALSASSSRFPPYTRTALQRRAERADRSQRSDMGTSGGQQQHSRYLDPTRPYKCDVCRDSFTQKSIFLSHLNNVSHLHRLQQLQRNLPAASCSSGSTVSKEQMGYDVISKIGRPSSDSTMEHPAYHSKDIQSPGASSEARDRTRDQSQHSDGGAGQEHGFVPNSERVFSAPHDSDDDYSEEVVDDITLSLQDSRYHSYRETDIPVSRVTDMEQSFRDIDRHNNNNSKTTKQRFSGDYDVDVGSDNDSVDVNSSRLSTMKSYTCTACNARCQGREDWSSHCSSSDHVAAVMEARRETGKITEDKEIGGALHSGKSWKRERGDHALSPDASELPHDRLAKAEYVSTKSPQSTSSTRLSPRSDAFSPHGQFPFGSFSPLHFSQNNMAPRKTNDGSGNSKSGGKPKPSGFGSVSIMSEGSQCPREDGSTRTGALSSSAEVPCASGAGWSDKTGGLTNLSSCNVKKLYESEMGVSVAGDGCYPGCSCSRASLTASAAGVFGAEILLQRLEGMNPIQQGKVRSSRKTPLCEDLSHLFITADPLIPFGCGICGKGFSKPLLHKAHVEDDHEIVLDISVLEEMAKKVQTHLKASEAASGPIVNRSVVNKSSAVSKPSKCVKSPSASSKGSLPATSSATKHHGGPPSGGQVVKKKRVAVTTSATTTGVSSIPLGAISAISSGEIGSGLASGTAMPESVISTSESVGSGLLSPHNPIGQADPSAAAVAAHQAMLMAAISMEQYSAAGFMSPQMAGYSQFANLYLSGLFSQATAAAASGQSVAAMYPQRFSLPVMGNPGTSIGLPTSSSSGQSTTTTAGTATGGQLSLPPGSLAHSAAQQNQQGGVGQGQQQGGMGQAQQQGHPGQEKRARTRINDEQLAVLREYFDINNSPTEEQVIEMSQRTGLIPKVIKHWFRNTLFKERQRDKQSPYNFTVPPQTSINSEEYARTGMMPPMLSPTDAQSKSCPSSNTAQTGGVTDTKISGDEHAAKERVSEESTQLVSDTSSEKMRGLGLPLEGNNVQVGAADDRRDSGAALTDLYSDERRRSFPSVLPPANSAQHTSTPVASSSKTFLKAVKTEPISSSLISFTSSGRSTHNQLSKDRSHSAVTDEVMSSFRAAAAASGHLNEETFTSSREGIPSSHPRPTFLPMTEKSEPYSSWYDHPALSASTHHSSQNKRANRTRFSDGQIKGMQDVFDVNAYPKDEVLEALSETLGLPTRVIVVWFQNQRQKQRKHIESTHSGTGGGHTAVVSSTADGSTSSSSSVSSATVMTSKPQGDGTATTGVVYSCRFCSRVFTAYYELAKHQQKECLNEKAIPDPFKSASTGVIPLDPSQRTKAVSSERDAISRSHVGISVVTKGQTRPEISSVKREHAGELALGYGLSTATRSGVIVSNEKTTPSSSTKYGESKRKMSPDRSQSTSQKKRRIGMSEMSTAGPFPYSSNRSSALSSSALWSSRGAAFPPPLTNEALAAAYGASMAHYMMGAAPSPADAPAYLPIGSKASTSTSNWESRHTSASLDRRKSMGTLFPGSNSSSTHSAVRSMVSTPSRHVGGLYMDLEASGSSGSIRPDSAIGVSESGLEEGSPSPLDLSKAHQSSDTTHNRHGTPFAANTPASSVSPSVTPSLSVTPNTYSVKQETSAKGSSYVGIKDETSSVYSESGGRAESVYSSVATNASLAATNREGSGLPSSHDDQSAANKRFRTNLSQEQIHVMARIFAVYKTPTMSECEQLGRHLGLKKRVVQVWFQNARAKEKKRKLEKKRKSEPDVDGKPAATATFTPTSVAGSTTSAVTPATVTSSTVTASSVTSSSVTSPLSVMTSPASPVTSPVSIGTGAAAAVTSAGESSEECDMCKVRFTMQHTLQDHFFSAEHVGRLKTAYSISIGGSGRKGGGSSSSRRSQQNRNRHRGKSESVTGPNSQPQPSASYSNEKYRKTTPSIEHVLPSSSSASTTSISLLKRPSATVSAASVNLHGLFSSAAGNQSTATMSTSTAPPVFPGMMEASSGAGIFPGGAFPGIEAVLPMLYSPYAMYGPAAVTAALASVQAYSSGPKQISQLDIPVAARESVHSAVTKEVDTVAYSQDGLSFGELRDALSNRDSKQTKEVLTVVGWVCRNCSYVFPKREAAAEHQSTVCSAWLAANSAGSLRRRLLKVVQRQIKCTVCDIISSTHVEYTQHLRGEEHQRCMKDTEMEMEEGAGH